MPALVGLTPRTGRGGCMGWGLLLSGMFGTTSMELSAVCWGLPVCSLYSNACGLQVLGNPWHKLLPPNSPPKLNN